MKSQAGFHKAQKLNFPLLSDPDGSVARKFGVLSRRGFTRRVTYIADPKGIIREVVSRVDVASHGGQVAEIIERLQDADKEPPKEASEK